MINTLLSILRIEFLISEKESFNNWKVIFFLSLLALFVIGSGHGVDRKVFEIAQLNKDINEMKSLFVENRAILMKMKMETMVEQKLLKKGIKQADRPPIKLID